MPANQPRLPLPRPVPTPATALGRELADLFTRLVVALESDNEPERRRAIVALRAHGLPVTVTHHVQDGLRSAHIQEGLEREERE